MPHITENTTHIKIDAAPSVEGVFELGFPRLAALKSMVKTADNSQGEEFVSYGVGNKRQRWAVCF